MTSKWARLVGIGVAAILVTGLQAHGIAPASAATRSARPVIVALTFDDGFADQLNARPILSNHRMNATFYVNSGRLDGPGRLTMQDVVALQSEGNEIGGHTVDHTNLPAQSPTEQLREICNDRVTLSRQGLRVVDFAYPYGAFDAQVQKAVAACGYSSARVTGGIGAAYAGCPDCVAEQALPARARLAIRAASSVVTGTRMSQVESVIRGAQTTGGGLVPLVFHNVCDGCSTMAVSPADLSSLLDWLARQPRVKVMTMAQALGSKLLPLNVVAVDPGSEAELLNPSLEQPNQGDGTGQPDGTSYCWQRSGYGTNTATWSRGDPAHAGNVAETVAVTEFTSGDRKLLIQQDSGECSPRVVPGHRYRLGIWYQSSATVRLMLFYRNTNGRWQSWQASPVQAASAGWKQASWTTPPMPVDAERVSFGLQIAQVGWLSVDDFSMRLETAASTGQAQVAGSASAGGTVAAAQSSPARNSTGALVSLSLPRAIGTILGLLVVAMLALFVPGAVRRRTMAPAGGSPGRGPETEVRSGASTPGPDVPGWVSTPADR
jgi:peptidoglycan/xylan/chitin deacetylase (PgdA/CDA1 family)